MARARTLKLRAVGVLLAVAAAFGAGVIAGQMPWPWVLIAAGLLAVGLLVWLRARKAGRRGAERDEGHLPAGILVFYMIASALLVIYGAYGIYAGDLYFPAKRGGIHLSGTAAWLMYGAMLGAATNMIAAVTDHFDRRNDEALYADVAVAASWVGWSLMIGAMFWDLFVPPASTS